MADGAPITESELAEAINGLEFFLVRAKGALAIVDRMKAVRTALAAERERRATLADLDRRADAVRAVIATADAAQAKLAGAEREMERHRTALQAVTDQAHAQAGSIINAAHTRAAEIIAQAQAAAAAEAERESGESQKRQAQIELLDADIAARRGELGQIHTAMRELRERFSA
jgi:hypothetical protein